MCLRERDSPVTLRLSDLSSPLSFLDDDTHDGRPQRARHSRHRTPSLSSRTHFVHLRIALLRDRRRDCRSLPTLRKVSPKDQQAGAPPGALRYHRVPVFGSRSFSFHPFQIYTSINCLTLISLQLRKHLRAFIPSLSPVLPPPRASCYRRILQLIPPHPYRPPRLPRVSSNFSQLTIPTSSFTISSDHMVRWLPSKHVFRSRRKLP